MAARLFCIFFALVGIPLNLVVLNRLGHCMQQGVHRCARRLGGAWKVRGLRGPPLPPGGRVSGRKGWMLAVTGCPRGWVTAGSRRSFWKSGFLVGVQWGWGGHCPEWGGVFSNKGASVGRHRKGTRQPSSFQEPGEHTLVEKPRGHLPPYPGEC